MENDNFDQKGMNGDGYDDNGQPPLPPKSNAGKFIGIGCLVIVLLFIVLGYAGYRALIGYMEGAVIEYTDTEPRELPQPLVSASESEQTLDSFDRFIYAVKNDEATKPLVLSGDQINQIISYHPDFEPFSDKMHVLVDDGLLSAEVSVPLDELKEMSELFVGRYLNAAVELEIELKNGRLEVYAHAIEVKGESVPEEYMQQISAENLAKDFNNKQKNEGAAEIIERLETIKITEDVIEIVPKKLGI
mgnify:CR=1 FL=1